MAGKHTIQVSVLADTKKFSSAMRGLSDATGLTKLGDMAKKVGTAVVTVAGAAAAGAGVLVGKGVGMASDLEQSLGAVDAVFKTSAGQIHDWAKSAATDLGLTQNEYNELATLMGTQLKNGGTALDELGGKTNNLMVLGSDLAAMFGGSTADAVGALSSALKGERDPIEKYGVSLKQATIDAKAAAMGFEKVGGSLTDEAQQAATLALIMEQTADAHGTFAAESDTLAGKQQRLQATMGNLTTTLGTIFLPLISDLAGWVGDKVMPALENWVGVLERNLGPALDTLGTWMTTTVLPAISQLGTWIKDNVVPALQQMGDYITTVLWPALQSFGQWLIDAQGWLIPLGVAIGAIVAVWVAWNAALNIWTAITKVAAATQALLNTVMKANPIVLVVSLIVGLVAALVTLYKNNEKVREVIDKAWAGIKAAISVVVNWITGSAVPWITGAWDKLSSGVTNMWNTIKGAFNSVKNGVLDMYNGIKAQIDRALTAVGNMATGVGDKIGAVVDWFTGLPGRIASALFGLPNKMLDIGQDVVQGLIDGIKKMATKAVDAVKGVVDGAIGGAKRLLGIKSPSRVFMAIGQQTGDGLRLGLEAGAQGVRRAAAGLADTVSTYGTPDPLNVSAGGSLAAAGAGGLTVNINVPHMIAPSPELGRIVADALRPYLRNGGILG